MLNNILRAFAPLLLSASLMLVWVILIATLVILWLVGKFRDGSVTTGVVTLLALVILPLSSWLLGRSFFRAGIFAGVESSGLAAISEDIGSVLENSRKPVEPEEPSGGASGEPVSSPAPDVPTDPGARKPEDYTDEELLKLAEENCDDMIASRGFRMRGGLDFDPNEYITIQYSGPSSSANIPGPYYFRIIGCTTPEDAETMSKENLLTKYARKYVEVEGSNGSGYIPFNGGVYGFDPLEYMGFGGSSYLPFIVDGIIDRTDDEVTFTGHWDGEEGEMYGEAKFSLVYEDGRWKYGYFN